MNVDAQDEQARDMRCKERRHPKHHGERREQGQDGEVTERREASHAPSGLARVAPTSPISRTNVSIAARRVRNAVTTSGSNCIPAPPPRGGGGGPCGRSPPPAPEGRGV